ncbi:MAG: cadherin-like domain-containing protein, partial [Polaromonas sp.]
MADIIATDGNDHLNGGSGADTIDGGGGNDVINSGAGSDIIDGGSGSDRLNGGSGSDTLIYNLFENAGATDMYMGGSGIDAVRIVLTATEWGSSIVQQEIRKYLQHLATVKTNGNTGEVSNGTASDFTFDFGNNTRLTVSMMERLVVVVDGETIDPYAPFITSYAEVTIAENTTAVTTVTAFDIDAGSTLTYSIVGGADGSLFQIDPHTGVLSFVTGPNYEVPTDVGGNNIYDVKVQVSDGTRVDTQDIAVGITNVNEAPTTTEVTLAAMAEDSGARLITQAELLANASDVDGPSLTATGLAIAAGSGTLVDNLDGSWSYTPALNDDSAVSFNYSVTDGSLAAAGSATLDLTPVNDAPVTTEVTLAAMAEDSGARLITQAELLANASDVDGPSLTATGLAI